MMTKEHFKNYCIKTIKNNQYVYSWSYRPKSLRSSRRPQRFNWKYRGRYDSVQSQNFISTLTANEQIDLQEDYKRRVLRQKEERAIIEKIEMKEPFLSEKKQIESICNRHNRVKKLKIFQAKLKILAEQMI